MGQYYCILLNKRCVCALHLLEFGFRKRIEKKHENTFYSINICIKKNTSFGLL